MASLIRLLLINLRSQSEHIDKYFMRNKKLKSAAVKQEKNNEQRKMGAQK